MAWCQQMWIWWVFLRESLNFMSMGAKMILSFALGHVTYSSKCFVQSKSFNITKPSKSSYNLISPGHKNTSSLKHTLRWICTISQPHFFSKKFFFHFRGSSSPIMEKHPLTIPGWWHQHTVHIAKWSHIISPIQNAHAPQEHLHAGMHWCSSVEQKKHVESLLSQNDRNQSSLESTDPSRILNFPTSQSKLRFQGSTSWRSFESSEWYMIKLYSFSTF